MKKKIYTRVDPFLEREREKYKSPIASREHILGYLKSLDRPASIEEIKRVLGVEGEDSYIALKRRLRAMVRDGQLLCDKEWRFSDGVDLSVVEGQLTLHRDGYGFLKVDGVKKDYIVSPDSMLGYMTGDKVVARLLPKARGRHEARIIRIIAERDPDFVGRVIITNGVMKVEPHNIKGGHRFILGVDGHKTLNVGDVVLAKIEKRASQSRAGYATFKKKLGDLETPNIATLIAIDSYKLPKNWPKAVLSASEQLGNTNSTNEKDRIDLRALPFVTIDSESAKDFDDAVYGEVNHKRDGWEIYVAIADVSHYIPAGSTIDLEAKRRGTSIYFANRVLPMLPEKLSNDLCSLIPGADRPALVCQLSVSLTGVVNDYRFYTGLIKSHQRLTYRSLNSELETNGSLPKCLPYLAPLWDAYKAIAGNRARSGVLDIDREVWDVELNDIGVVESLKGVGRGEADRLIEELMIQANVAAAQFIHARNLGGLYRTHERPDNAKIGNLILNIEHIIPSAKNLHAGSPLSAYSELLNELEGKPEAAVAQIMILRSLKTAIYEAKKNIHFGLGVEAYTHFTSPIRRYPDLVVHRIIKHLLALESSKSPIDASIDHIPYTYAELTRIAEDCNELERRGDAASKEVLDWHKCAYLKERLNRGTVNCRGVVSGSTHHAIFVKLSGIDIDGMIPTTTLSSGTADNSPDTLRPHFKVGDVIDISVEKVSLWSREIELRYIKSRADENINH